MTFKLIIKPEAKADIADVRAWYRAINKDLAKRFRQDLDAALERVRATPLVHAAEHREARRALLHQFPYFIVYRVEGSRVFVLGVFHERRDPALWQSRVEQSPNGDE